ncbi:MAG: hypothetical protein R3D34_09185 [Nitratireductor sp.]
MPLAVAKVMARSSPRSIPSHVHRGKTSHASIYKDTIKCKTYLDTGFAFVNAVLNRKPLERNIAADGIRQFKGIGYLSSGQAWVDCRRQSLWLQRVGRCFSILEQAQGVGGKARNVDVAGVQLQPGQLS